VKNNIKLQIINSSDENNKIKSKVNESKDVMRKHMYKIKILCVVLVKLIDENVNFRNENESLSKGFNH